MWLGLMPLAAQSVTITKDFAQVPMASVLAMYKNEFGSYEKPDMTDTFPYAVIRMHLEGSGQSVREAKERLTLYMGQQMGVERRVTTYSNQILFLVRSRHPMIYIDCGDGCERVLLSNMQQLKSNCVYDCTVRYEPEKLNTEEAIDKEKLKQELLAELAAVLKDQGSNDITQHADLPTTTSSNPPISELNKDSYDTPDLLPNKHNGHEYVDLGLSVKWATCNVGANKPEEYGDYFAWGETTIKSIYKWGTYKYCYGSYNNLLKYNTNRRYGTIDSKTIIEFSDDAARANWGGSWRMPTEEELIELLEQCTWTWTTQNGVKGYKVMSKSNGNSIFLPAAGYRDDSSLYRAGYSGFIWSSSLGADDRSNGCSMSFHFSHVYMDAHYRYYGLSVRPVCQ